MGILFLNKLYCVILVKKEKKNVYLLKCVYFSCGLFLIYVMIKNLLC